MLKSLFAIALALSILSASLCQAESAVSAEHRRTRVKVGTAIATDIITPDILADVETQAKQYNLKPTHESTWKVSDDGTGLERKFDHENEDEEGKIYILWDGSIRYRTNGWNGHKNLLIGQWWKKK